MACSQGSPAPFGVIHVRRRLTKNFTVLLNRLAQRRGSAVTVGVGVYLHSVPEGTKVSIEALRERFDEGEVLLARALRELEAEGWLRRRIVRAPDGRFQTHTYVFDDPALPDEEPAPGADEPPTAVDGTNSPVEQPRSPERPRSDGEPPAPGALPFDDEQLAGAAEGVLHAVRERDDRLAFSRSELAELTPLVADWLRHGVWPRQIVRALADGLPEPLNSRPSRIVAYRLKHHRPEPWERDPEPDRVPLRSCSACGRPFRAAADGPCPDCRTGAPPEREEEPEQGEQPVQAGQPEEVEAPRRAEAGEPPSERDRPPSERARPSSLRKPSSRRKPSPEQSGPRPLSAASERNIARTAKWLTPASG